MLRERGKGKERKKELMSMFEVMEWSVGNGKCLCGQEICPQHLPSVWFSTATAPIVEHHFPCGSKKMALIITSPSSLQVSHPGTDKPSANSSSLRKAEPEVLTAVTVMQLI